MAIHTFALAFLVTVVAETIFLKVFLAHVEALDSQARIIMRLKHVITAGAYVGLVVLIAVTAKDAKNLVHIVHGSSHSLVLVAALAYEVLAVQTLSNALVGASRASNV